MKRLKQFTLAAGLAALATSGLAAADDYYKQEPQFHMWPDPGAARYKIARFGPVGIGLELRQPAFTMHIVNIEEGSPAAASGKLKNGQIIESINGKVLKDEDPRVLLGNWITEAEAKDGVMKMMVKDTPDAAAEEVIVKIPALGAYSPTWPVDCKKTDRIIRAHADALAANIESAQIGLNGAVLFMLSTGEEKDLEVVRGWMKKFVEDYKKPGEGYKTYPWFAGYTGPGFCEYYLRTGDESVLPAIKDMADSLSRTIYNGSWMGRGDASYGYMGGGHLNAAGLHAATFLLMAKECGVDVDEHTLLTSMTHVYRFAGHGNVAYGDHLPEGGFTANGKTEGLAFTMKAAANLHPDGEKSIYAKASNISANKSFYNTSWLFHGHTGGGIGELWKGRAMGLVKEERPEPYRSFMNERLWMYELARTHNGVFGWVSDWNVSYTDTGIEKRGWGAYIPLVYTLPRKALRLHGAPPTKYSHTYKIPDRPWGNEADEIFLSLTPGEYLPGKRQDVSKELLPTDASKPILARLKDSEVTDETILMYAHHFEHGVRAIAAGTINNQKRFHLIPQLLKSQDPRARYAALDSINSSDKKSAGFPAEELTPEIVGLIGAMIANPDESWWVTMGAMEAMGRATPDQIAPHFDRMLAWLDHEDWWLRQAAMKGLTPVAGDKLFHKQFLTKVGKIIQTSHRLGDFSPLDGIVSQLQNADPEIRKFAIGVIGESYVNFPEEITEPGGQDLTNNVELLLDVVAKDLVKVPGGYDMIYQLGKKRNPDAALPHQELFLEADSEQFGPELKTALKPIIKEQLIPQYIEKNRAALEKEIATRQPGRATEGLVDLHKKAGNDEYKWKLHGPARDEIEWHYLTFDPPEKKLWEQGHRFREVTVPDGAGNWFTAAFDPKPAGWKTGKAPFANYDGKPVAYGTCKGEDHFCGCGNPVNTFWDKETLLMRSMIELPPLRDGYAYRLLVGGRSHYNIGGGTDVWIDGERIENRKKNEATVQAGSGRNSGVPWGATIADDFRSHFEDGKILLACNGFLRWGHRTEKITSYMTIWFEEMKLPDIGE